MNKLVETPATVFPELSNITDRSIEHRIDCLKTRIKNGELASAMQAEIIALHHEIVDHSMTVGWQRVPESYLQGFSWLESVIVPPAPKLVS